MLFGYAWISGDTFDPVVYTHCLNSTGEEIILFNNINSTDPTYKGAIDFIKEDHTDTHTYTPGKYVCIDYASDFHRKAEDKGLKCGLVSIDFEDYSIGHSVNVFNTTDKGLLVVDCSNHDHIEPVTIGEDYNGMGKIKDYKIYW